MDLCESQGQEQAQMDQDREQEVERAKLDLLHAVMDTKRGVQVTPDQRAAIEEAMVRCLIDNLSIKLHIFFLSFECYFHLFSFFLFLQNFFFETVIFIKMELKTKILLSHVGS